MELAELAVAHPRLFAGAVREPLSSIEHFGRQLGVAVPRNLIDLACTVGVGASGAFCGTVGSIEATSRFRRAVGLPHHFVVLDDRNDAGVVFLDTSAERGSVLWVDTYACSKLRSGSVAPGECDMYENLEAWVAYCAEERDDEA